MEAYDLLAGLLADEREESFDVECKDAAAAIAAEAKKSKKERKYKQIDTYVRNVIFIRLQLEKNPNPCDLMAQIFAEIKKQGKCNSRFICRMLPVHNSCASSPEAIEKCILDLIDTLYPSKEEESTFVMNVTIRNCDLSSRKIIEAISPVILKMRPKWKVSFDDPKVTVNVEILTKVACVSLIPGMKEFRRYNLLEYAKKVSGEGREETSHEKDVKKEDDRDKMGERKEDTSTVCKEKKDEDEEEEEESATSDNKVNEEG